MTEKICTQIYKQWHEFAKAGQVEKLIELYADNAILESPLVPIILDKSNGVLNGRDEIFKFLTKGTKRRPNELVKWHIETDHYFVKNNVLIWEYPRIIPDGEQVDIIELMELENQKIKYHRIYWGWLGTQMLIKSIKK